MNDDFNTPEAMAVLFDLANDVNKTNDPDTAALLKSLAAIVGLLQRDADAFLQGDTAHDLESDLDVDALIQARLQAKKDKDFAKADAIRQELQDAGILLEDTPQGTTWRSA